MLRDRLRKLMADWGSHPAAPVDYLKKQKKYKDVTNTTCTTKLD